LPIAFLILFLLITLVSALTWIVSIGQYGRPLIPSFGPAAAPPATAGAAG